MGVSGSGKSTVGSALARRLRVPFVDADTLHPRANIAKMTAGEPLNDADRYPWLEKVGEWLANHCSGGVASCSALKRKYRDQLRVHCPRVEFLHLSGSPGMINRRPHCYGRNSTLWNLLAPTSVVSPSISDTMSMPSSTPS
jgi:gluconokinase